MASYRCVTPPAGDAGTLAGYADRRRRGRRRSAPGCWL